MGKMLRNGLFALLLSTSPAFAEDSRLTASAEAGIYNFSKPYAAERFGTMNLTRLAFGYASSEGGLEIGFSQGTAKSDFTFSEYDYNFWVESNSFIENSLESNGFDVSAHLDFRSKKEDRISLRFGAGFFNTTFNEREVYQEQENSLFEGEGFREEVTYRQNVTGVRYFGGAHLKFNDSVSLGAQAFGHEGSGNKSKDWDGYGASVAASLSF